MMITRMRVKYVSENYENMQDRFLGPKHPTINFRPYNSMCMVSIPYEKTDEAVEDDDTEDTGDDPKNFI